MNYIRTITALGCIFFVTTMQSKETQPQEVHHNQYQQELRAFKKSPDYKMIFDKKANPLLRGVRANIENYKELTLLQRLVRYPVFIFDVVVVTPKTMPKLHTYVDSICKKASIKTPPIFITMNKGIFNAFALKLLASTGAIVVGQDMIFEIPDEALEAVLVHEIGHIKHNHVNKKLLLNLGTLAGYFMFLKKYNFFPNSLCGSILEGVVLNMVSQLIIGKRFERQADEFAYKTMGKGEGLIQFFNQLKQKEQEKEAEFKETHRALKKNKRKIASSDYQSLMLSYYVARIAHLFDDACKWVYHNTRLGAHPSHDERIETIKTHMISEWVSSKS